LFNRILGPLAETRYKRRSEQLTRSLAMGRGARDVVGGLFVQSRAAEERKGLSPGPSSQPSSTSSSYAMPAAFSAPRIVDGVIGAWRTRAPVASKNAFAIAELIAVVGGSPEPLSNQPWLNAAVLPA
jgi:hypothetical protein